MAGFLSAYNGTERVWFDKYWVELHKHVSTGAKEGSERLLQTLTVVDGKPCPAPDVVRSRQMAVLASIADWNLDDANGTIWPVNLQNVKRLPEAVFDELRRKVDEFAEPAPAEERRRFPDEGDGGDPNGNAGASEPVDVPGGAGAVEAAWAEA